MPVPDLAFVNGRAILPDSILEDAVVICREGRLVYVGRARSKVTTRADVVDLRGNYLSPGFIDLHVHGGADSDFMDGTVDAVRTACRAHMRHGTTTIFPTTSTGSDGQIHQMIAACKEVMEKDDPSDGARIGGVHLYGPYFASDKAGCHTREHCRSPKAAEFTKYFQSGIIRIATCAAELEGAAAFYRAAYKRGCLVTCGHSNASWTEMEKAFKAGMRHVDHFWCAMSNVSSVRARLGSPMQGSMLEYVLDNNEMSTEVIADGMHLAPELLRFAWRMKGPQRLCLVTDANRALDMPPGQYRFGPQEDGSFFESDGQVGWASPGSLASSVRGMDHMVRTMHRQARIPLPDAVRMASLTPAERVGIQHETGSIDTGKRADLIILDRGLKVKRVYRASNCVNQ